MAARSTQVLQYYKSRVIIMQLLQRQGYNTTDYATFSSETVAQWTDAQRSFNVCNETGKTAHVRYVTGLKNSHIAQIAEDIFANSGSTSHGSASHGPAMHGSASHGPALHGPAMHDIILITPDEPNESLKAEQAAIWVRDRVFVTIFNLARLQFNVLDHVANPPCRVLTAEEQATILKKYRITNAETQLPDISRFGPVAQAIGLRPGQLCEITRPNKFAITELYYRICLNK